MRLSIPQAAPAHAGRAALQAIVTTAASARHAMSHCWATRAQRTDYALAHRRLDASLASLGVLIDDADRGLGTDERSPIHRSAGWGGQTSLATQTLRYAIPSPTYVTSQRSGTRHGLRRITKSRPMKTPRPQVRHSAQTQRHPLLPLLSCSSARMHSFLLLGC